jgi:hypothetical protein
MISLHKVLETDIERLIRFCYAEDPDLVAAYKSGDGNTLDSCVSTALSIITPGTTFFKVETSTGAIVGYFAQAPVVDINWALNGFVIRKAFRPSYLIPFFTLIGSTFENELTASLDANNFMNQDNIKNNFTITNPTFFSNKNYLLLKTYNSA